MNAPLYLKNIVFNNKTTDALLENGTFRKIEPNLSPVPGAQIIDAHGELAMLPPFYNGHTHAAMTLLRGFADDMELFPWLQNYIWPTEAKLTRENIYAGTRLAILEMIKSGTVFFNDMYWFQRDTLRACEEMGMRACIGLLQLKSGNPEIDSKIDNEELFENRNSFSKRISLSLAPHSIYVVPEKILRETAERAADLKMFIYIHLAETQQEFDDCMKEHGMTPTRYLDSLGLLTDRSILAHSIYVTDDDIRLLAERNVFAVTAPYSNMKLVSGYFPYKKFIECKCRWGIGTDGTASNNTLSMIEEVKICALLAKNDANDPRILPAPDAFRTASAAVAEAFSLHGCGVISEGAPADCILVNLNNPRLIPNYHLLSNIVYSADSSCIDSVICDGRVLMLHGKVEGEEEIIIKAREAVRDLQSR